MKLSKLGFPYCEHDLEIQLMVDVLLLHKKQGKKLSKQVKEFVVTTMIRRHLIIEIFEAELEIIDIMRSRNKLTKIKNKNL